MFIMCFSACSPGRFGAFCTQTCSCPTNSICDRFTGECLCETGDDCKQGKIQMDFPMNTKANTETFIDFALQSSLWFKCCDIDEIIDPIWSVWVLENDA